MKGSVAPNTHTTTTYNVKIKRFRGSTRKGKTLTAVISANTWCYIVNEKGNARASTLLGWGSCPPADKMQEFINYIPDKMFFDIWNDCEKAKEKVV